MPILRFSNPITYMFRVFAHQIAQPKKRGLSDTENSKHVSRKVSRKYKRNSRNLQSVDETLM